MRVALIAPQSIRPITFQGGVTQFEPPGGLLTLAAAIRDRTDVHIVDAQIDTLSPEETAQAALASNPDMVGISVNFVSLIRNAEAVARYVRENAPGVPIVFGGNYSTFFSNELIREDWVDAVILHEADLSFPTFMERFAQSGRLEPVSGSVVKVAGEIERREFTDYVKDLDTLPFAAYDLLPQRDRYLTTVITSRGCVFDCMYCSTRAMWGTWRMRSAGSVLKQIDELIPTLPKRRLNFCDDIFTVRRKRVVEICEGLLERGTPLAWGMNARAETLDEELISLLGRAGCRSIFFGFESASERVLRLMDRRYTAADIERITDLCIDAGIIPHASFMIGIPWETRKEALETLSLIERINTPYVLLNLFTPLVGTPIHRRPEDYGVTLLDGVEGQNGQLDNGFIHHTTQSMTAEEIKELWIEGTGIVVSRARERDAYEAHQLGNA